MKNMKSSYIQDQNHNHEKPPSQERNLLQKKTLAHEKQAFLTLCNNSGLQKYRLGEYVTLGKSVENQIQVIDEKVSSKHLRIDLTYKGFLLQDLKSHHGTFVNNTYVLSCYLKEGDRINVGHHSFLFSQTFSHYQDHFKSLKSQNPSWQKQLSKLPQISQSNFPVLIAGPSGTGKELVARFIHNNSNRSKGPLVSINCSALNANLIESELFGHKKGSFTGAEQNRKGAFLAAQGGTLFLDEIGDLPQDFQPKFLRALENNEIKPVGSDSSLPTDVRIIAATHQNLKNHVIQEKFRADLFYRLNVLPISIPSLKNRLEDFENLLFQMAKHLKVHFTREAIEKLKQHPWPGNIRELKTAVARAHTFCEDKIVRETDIKHIVDAFNVRSYTSNKNLSLIQETEKKMICRSLMDHNGNQKKTAMDLGMPRSTLHDRIKLYEINIKQLVSKDIS